MVSGFDMERYIEMALDEDVRDGDITSMACIPEHQQSKAILKVKEDGVIAGVEAARSIFSKVDPAHAFEVFKEDGSVVHFGELAFEVHANTRALLKAERLVLNLMQRMSGIASLANRFKAEVEDLPVVLLDTRKTTPLNRYFEKWAVRLGGCANYRYGLFDRFMIKDNHIQACGGITQAIQAVNDFARVHCMRDRGITIEVKNLVEIEEVLSTGDVDQIMLDNFALALLREGVEMIGNRFKTEASGGVSLESVRKIAQTGVDFISVGALTHSAGSLDLSLKIQG
ncbi:MAG: carboxylating nicotinate-nucleotide diphosphorylase [Saprospiraceae bacterium]|nr:carboxylating nicotinate-nucleotide diphosphorylase [Saprospiraceae bacterium]